VRRGPGIAWIVVAVAALALTRSSTVVIATAVTIAVLVFALGTRSVRPDRRVPVYLTALAVAVLAAASVWLAWGRILAIFGKSEDLTGRLDIWQAVIAHAVQRPAFGWGWVSYWAPWAEPFTHMAVRKGVTYLQAHDAWLDVWLQIGIIGLVIFALLVATTLVRAWFLAVDRPRTGLDDTQPFTALALLPLLVLAALLAQSAAESRLLVEAGWTLLVVFSVKTKLARP
jgi:O-antigen ligase